ncbi:MAG: DUF5615 family PIN-like protein [Calditrichota bacterium]
MRLLLDTCVWGGALGYLRQIGHDVVWMGDMPEDPGDEEILNQAHRDNRIIVTLDKDFGEMAVRFGKPHAGIIRLVEIPARQQALICQQILNNYAEDLMNSALITVYANRVRIRISEN